MKNYNVAKRLLTAWVQNRYRLCLTTAQASAACRKLGVHVSTKDLDELEAGTQKWTARWIEVLSCVAESDLLVEAAGIALVQVAPQTDMPGLLRSNLDRRDEIIAAHPEAQLVLDLLAKKAAPKEIKQ